MLSNCAVFRGALLGSAVALAVSALPASAKPGLTVIHDFAGAPGDGAYPLVGVTFDSAGDMYGVTYVGGAYNLGTLFEIAPDGTETIVRSFGNGNDGAFPRSQPAIDGSGNLYSTTNGGGGSINCDGGCGTIWEYGAGGKYKVLHKFDFTDGSQPVGQLLRDKAGNLYGITTDGGSNNQGEVFEYTAGGTFKVLHTFAGTDGAYPECSLIEDRSGNLYGTTESGGSS
ncbi:MAG TPA: choice-of-anchor tandem repeat GloVer-containing protein, partial [Tepidisphaeraceae bacterium]|nr:choice-of-anchor tandem repeat GloVer-containing protein [Tepidisphaeraceae bacterium]